MKTRPLVILTGLFVSLSIPSCAAPTTFPLSKRALITTQGSEVNGKSFDYIIVGGGLSGSVLARRLADANGGSQTVLLVEAGEDQEGNANVYGEQNRRFAFRVTFDI